MDRDAVVAVLCVLSDAASFAEVGSGAAAHNAPAIMVAQAATQDSIKDLYGKLRMFLLATADMRSFRLAFDEPALFAMGDCGDRAKKAAVAWFAASRRVTSVP